MGVFDEMTAAARKLMNESMYVQAIEEYGKIIELVFKELYREYFPQLPYSDKERVINYEKYLGKTVDKFMMGEWIGLFREARMFDFVKIRKKIERNSPFFSYSLIDVLLKLRNRATHPSEERSLDLYDKRSVASFMESAVLCILRELGVQPDIADSHLPGLPYERSGVSRRFADVSKDDILKAARDPRVNGFRWMSTYTVIGGKRYAVKGLLSLASNVPPSKFTTNQAERVLVRLGFNIIHLKRKLAATPASARPIEPATNVLEDSERKRLMGIKLDKEEVLSLLNQGFSIWETTERVYGRRFNHSDRRTWIFYQKVNNIRHAAGL